MVKPRHRHGAGRQACLAPSAASSSTTARPMPEVPPVTRQVRPAARAGGRGGREACRCTACAATAAHRATPPALPPPPQLSWRSILYTDSPPSITLRAVGRQPLLRSRHSAGNVFCHPDSRPDGRSRVSRVAAGAGGGSLRIVFGSQPRVAKNNEKTTPERSARALRVFTTPVRLKDCLCAPPRPQRPVPFVFNALPL